VLGTVTILNVIIIYKAFSFLKTFRLSLY